MVVLRTALHHAVYSSTGGKANVVLANESVAPRECGLAGWTPCEGLVWENDGVPTRRLAGTGRRPCTPPQSAATWGYRILPQPVGVQTRAASTVSAARSRTCGRLYSCDTRLDGRAQDFQEVASELWLFIQEESAAVHPSDLARQPCRPMPLFVKHVPRPTIHGYERASCLPRASGDVVYQTTSAQAPSRLIPGAAL